jgi:hypothetical protein
VLIVSGDDADANEFKLIDDEKTTTLKATTPLLAVEWVDFLNASRQQSLESKPREPASNTLPDEPASNTLPDLPEDDEPYEEEKEDSGPAERSLAKVIMMDGKCYLTTVTTTADGQVEVEACLPGGRDILQLTCLNE